MNIRMIKKNGNLVPATDKDAAAVKNLKTGLEEGAIVDVYLEAFTKKGSSPQIAKLHAMIREFSFHTGYTFEESKLVVKAKAGLCFTTMESGIEGVNCKSFSDCSRDELSIAIETCVSLFETVGCNGQI
jgi:hypothetical protein